MNVIHLLDNRMHLLVQHGYLKRVNGWTNGIVSLDKLEYARVNIVASELLSKILILPPRHLGHRPFPMRLARTTQLSLLLQIEYLGVSINGGGHQGHERALPALLIIAVQIPSELVLLLLRLHIIEALPQSILFQTLTVFLH